MIVAVPACEGIPEHAGKRLERRSFPADDQLAGMKLASAQFSAVG